MDLNLKKRTALLVFGVCGLVSVSVDIDHALAILLWRYKYPSLDEGRIFHPVIFSVSCLLLGSLYTYLGGLYIRLVLRRRRDGRE